MGIIQVLDVSIELLNRAFLSVLKKKLLEAQGIKYHSNLQMVKPALRRSAIFPYLTDWMSDSMAASLLLKTIL